jgi:hypothetical protein
VTEAHHLAPVLREIDSGRVSVGGNAQRLSTAQIGILLPTLFGAVGIFKEAQWALLQWTTESKERR